MKDREIINCPECGKPVDPKESGNYIEMFGWSKYRGSTGGSNSLRNKKLTGRVMHDSCMETLLAGKKGQSSLF